MTRGRGKKITIFPIRLQFYDHVITTSRPENDIPARLIYIFPILTYYYGIL